jgi:phenylpyruvate tautomerase PptA (4-oxalocrotonate tautomerase family)
MPTYTVTTLEGCLDTSKRAEIASEITRIHSETTGAPTYFAQVIFTEIAPDRYFVGGSPLKAHQVFVNGQIRAGRSTESKDSLIMQITAAVAAASKLPKRNVWVYITDLVPRQMVEFGHALPEAGEEARWAAALPEADRAHMQSYALRHYYKHERGDQTCAKPE